MARCCQANGKDDQGRCPQERTPGNALQKTGAVQDTDDAKHQKKRQTLIQPAWSRKTPQLCRLLGDDQTYTVPQREQLSYRYELNGIWGIDNSGLTVLHP